jgi:hypothetical protein
VAWLTKLPEEKELTMILNFEWTRELQQCIDAALPLTEFVAVDVRTNGTDILVLEINGVAGMPYVWTTGERSMMGELWEWLWTRYHAGVSKLNLDRAIKLALLFVQRHGVRRQAIRNPRNREALF